MRESRQAAVAFFVTIFYIVGLLVLFTHLPTDPDPRAEEAEAALIEAKRQRCVSAFERTRLLRELEEMVNPVPIATLQQKDYRRLQACLKATRR